MRKIFILLTFLLAGTLMGQSFGVARGTFPNMTPLHKFGYANSGVQATATDIWDRADATPTQQLWVPPTEPRIHKIVSSSTSDSGAQSGAITVQLFGLTSWDTEETSERVFLEGTDSVLTSNEYVIIHRMYVDSGAVNVGNIHAVADSDWTVTAQISAGRGQTLMAIYGVPSTKNFYLTQWYADLLKSSGTEAHIEMRLLMDLSPEQYANSFVTKSVRGIQSTGSSSMVWHKDPYRKFSGPAIIKVQGVASGADINCSAGFDIILEDK